MPENQSPLDAALFDTAAEDARVAAAYQEALHICRVLFDAGHTAYFAGGCVRDALLGRLPKDFDVATDATPERVREIFGYKKTLAFGASFGVIVVLPRKRGNEKSGDPDSAGSLPIDLEPTEVATFRSDGSYSDGRRPDEVHFGDAENDAQRRDFTINGLFYDPINQKVIDYVGGKEDLRLKRLRTIGLASDRFEEDKLRMLRAVRFATTLGFELEPQTRNEIQRRANEICVVSPERVGAEMRRVVASPNLTAGIERIIQCELAPFVIPGIELRNSTVLAGRIAAVQCRTFPVCLAVLLESASKSTESTLEGLERSWRLSNEEVRQTSFALDQWPKIAMAHQTKWSLVQPILIDRDAEFAIAAADAITTADEQLVKSVSSTARHGIQLVYQALQWPMERLNPEPLITGDVLRANGYRPGPSFRHWLQSIRALQLDGKLSSEAEAFAWIQENG